MRFFREPLVQFLILGAALFVVFRFIGNAIDTQQITLSAVKIEELIKGFRYDNKRSPTPLEVERLIEDYIREEILSREAIAQGLPLEIPAVRRELRQKMEFQSDSAETPAPTDAQLQSYLDSHAATFRKPDGSLPPLSEIRDTVASAWAAAVQRDVRDAAYERLRERYNVVVHRPATTGPATQTEAQ